MLTCNVCHASICVILTLCLSQSRLDQEKEQRRQQRELLNTKKEKDRAEAGKRGEEFNEALWMQAHAAAFPEDSEEEDENDETDPTEKLLAKAMKDPTVKSEVASRVGQLISACQKFLDRIYRTVHLLPYGVRFLVSQMYNASLEGGMSENVAEINAALLLFDDYLLRGVLVPSSAGVLDAQLYRQQPEQLQRNLGMIAKVLHTLAVKEKMQTDKQKFAAPVNDFLVQSQSGFSDFLYDVMAIESLDAYSRKAYFESYLSQLPKSFRTRYSVIFTIHEMLSDPSVLAELAPRSNDTLQVVCRNLDVIDTSEHNCQYFGTEFHDVEAAYDAALDSDESDDDVDGFENKEERKARRHREAAEQKEQRRLAAEGKGAGANAPQQCPECATYGYEWMKPMFCPLHAKFGMKEVGFQHLPFHANEFKKVALVDKYMEKPVLKQEVSGAEQFFMETKRLLALALQNMEDVAKLNLVYGGECATNLQNALSAGLRDALSREDFTVADYIQQCTQRLSLMEKNGSLTYDDLQKDLLIDLRNFSFVQVTASLHCMWRTHAVRI